MNETVACSLAIGDFHDRTQVWRELLGSQLLSREPTRDGCVLTLSAAPGVAAAVRRLAELEAACCAWMEVQVIDGAAVTVKLSSLEPGGPEAIRELFQAG